MEITTYHSIIQELLEHYRNARISSYPGIEPRLVVDDKNYIYLLLYLGWDNKERVHECTIHIEIIDNKIWIQLNNTDISITDYLFSKGVSKDNIVLGMHHPEKRF